MGPFKRKIRNISIASITQEPWGTRSGIEAFVELSSLIGALPDGTLVELDFAGLERSDVNFQREAIVELMVRFRPRLLFIARGLSDLDVRANLELALLYRTVTLMLCTESTFELLGKPLPTEFLATLRAVSVAGEITSAKLTEAPFNLESSTASARLTALWKGGLVHREQGAAISGGREYRYFSLC